jgi:hypothetical protein
MSKSNYIYITVFVTRRRHFEARESVFLMRSQEKILVKLT